MTKSFRFFAFSFALLFSIVSIADGIAQDKNRRKKAWPDSLRSVTLEGTVVIDSTHENIYFLEVDGDTIVDYALHFGPDWYSSESGAERPQDGDVVTIIGSINPKPQVPIVIVFEINGLLWREPVENWWKHDDWYDSIELTLVKGTILIDTTYFYVHYFLDTDGDEQPNYFLNFGPPWYEPQSGISKPAEGETVTVEGIIKTGTIVDRLVVIKLNDEIWREKNGPAPWKGGWVGRDKMKQKRIHSPIDDNSWIEFPPGAMQGGGKNGPQFPDSIFCDFMQVYRDSLPNFSDSMRVGWYFHFSDMTGKKIRGNGRGQAVKFIKRLRMNLNLCKTDSSNVLAKLSSNEYTLKYWDEDINQWIEETEVIYDAANQTLILEPEDLNSYYAVFSNSDVSTQIGTKENTIASDYILNQNFPNPFNPTTTIGYQINKPAYVQIKIYNAVGQEVRTLFNEFKLAGSYQAVWDARDNLGRMLPSGFYIYQLKAGNQTITKRMVLMK